MTPDSIFENVSFDYKVFRNRSDVKALTMNFKNTSNTGFSIDFNYQQGMITVFRIENGSTVGSKSVLLT